MSPPRRRSRPRFAGSSLGVLVCVALFALPFFGVGLFVLAKSCRLWALHVASAGWRQVPAELLEVKLVSHRGRSTSHEVVARYRYVFPPLHDGTAYVSSALDVGLGPSDDAYHEERHAWLREAQEARHPVLALVDPARPARSILFRAIEPPMIAQPLFGFLFAGFGGGILVGLLLGARDEARRRRALRRDPRRPWKAHAAWGSHAIPSEQSGARLAAGWLLLALVQAFVGFFWLDLADGDWSAITVVIGTILQVGVAAGGGSAALATLRRIRYGRCALVLGELPVVPARDLRARVDLPRRIHAGARFQVELRCTGRRRRADGTAEETIEAAREIEATGEPGARGTLLRLQLPVPADAPETADAPEAAQATEPGTEQGGGAVTWRLHLTGALPGLDVDESWEIPVFRPEPRLVERNADF